MFDDIIVKKSDVFRYQHTCIHCGCSIITDDSDEGMMVKMRYHYRNVHNVEPPTSSLFKMITGEENG